MPASRTSSDTNSARPWWWVPSLYFGEGVPYVVVMTVAVIMFKRLGVGNAEIALYTSWLYLPYTIKPLWSPLVQRIGTRRAWIIVMQLLIAAGLVCTALAIPLDSFLQWSLMALSAVAICSATHDVAADGYYLLSLSSHQQAWFVGVRSTAYRMATIAGQGLLVMLAGVLESATGLPTVTVEVRALEHEPASIRFEPTQTTELGGDSAQKVLVESRELDVSLRGRPVSEVTAIMDAVRDRNVQNGFYPPLQKKEAEQHEPSWLVRFEDFIRRRYGRKRSEPADQSGDIAIVQMRMAQPVPPGQQQVIQFGRSSGDASFDVIEGERFEVSARNWNQPFVAVVQVDADLHEPSGATFEIRSGNIRLAWSVTFFVVAGVFVAFCIYHFLVLPRPAGDTPATRAATSSDHWIGDFLVPFADFFRKRRILAILAFLLLFRFPEAQLVKLTTPFLLDPREAGGLALTTGAVGFVYGTIGVIMLTVGGLIGGFVAARYGIGRCLWPMALAIHLPNLAFLFLSYAQPEQRWVITLAVAVEQFGYGFGFTAYLLYCVYVSTGNHETVHYALCTGFMALGMMIPGMWSGWLQELIGYQHFFVWIMLAMIPSLIAVALIPVDSEFGKKSQSAG